ncbi:uncharacterized protein LOC126816285 isoform X1 [Patella vulgata]|uniref:uncharacterized protein LOC126816285 isoform X1 n=1 Tax=Patella vulgata TaxID=6465 RepID=UPI00217F6171|nr:uncharacterized protein LOC126816285 isoform X1 [Patella vulgata]XP_050398561.1 uncharacterized protein LOC126816285 isoform X1 [Patella vulgata]XP_050398562.1 uncharacterized protein LOC126816285 isoform X1 [Patella vulgata]XP_050398563.1 uncharacterized protein LOC126816285 isoform X1 [Patella vulgata]XP_050398564.1 uncharacterized protein LOC126816285 isoform X1 [Patella vulgata]
MTKFPRYRRRYKKVLVLLGILNLVFFVTAQFVTIWKQPYFANITTEWNWNSKTNENPRTEHKYFIKVRGEDSYFLSAIAGPDTESPNQLNIVLSGLDGTRGYGKFVCCVSRSDGSMLTTPAEFYHKHAHRQFLPAITQLFYQADYDATQYVCNVQQTGEGVKYVNISLTAAACSDNAVDYLPIKHQKQVKQGLAICAKVAYGHLLKPSRLIEWFEMQKMLGVDKILVFDLACGDDIKTVFRHYVDEGLLEVQPYSLPGKMPGSVQRGFVNRVYPQVSHDEALTILDCHQRLGGYQYLMAADFDEITIPKHFLTLKQLLKNLTSENPTAAGFYFYVQFHLENWGRYRNDTDIFFQQHLRSAKPRWECEKYIYLPSRVVTAIFHSFTPVSSFTYIYVKPEVAAIHHYRQCPQGWTNCYPEIIVDKQVMKYEKLHTKNTHEVLKKLNMKSYDSLV